MDVQLNREKIHTCTCTFSIHFRYTLVSNTKAFKSYVLLLMISGVI